jgi:Cu-Zn family superoxide dismutase
MLADSGAYLGLSVGGLTPGLHGVHVHELPSCTAPDFESAGPHFNPAGREHGLENPSGPHAGDLPNIRVEKDGSADTTFRIDSTLLTSDSSSFLRDEGSSIVIHAGADDQRTQPSGASGARVACGVIRKQ